ncbi:hypothetical protein KVR01_002286 [Diaporthe batatas]|uniref:uncharacterized protein n=1 Tax=Diaporthe batatas TaxID=748121 RepID=UPI001D04861E|nr:uncharacterized protein KVR01_002286 [Diaporthe batatas]KAG8166597.1 hypothetical protein KVR01_002286 [Diaporthe batatas]
MQIKLFLFLTATAVAAMDLEPKFAALAFSYLNISFVPGAIEKLQSHGLWIPSPAALNGLEPMFGDGFNGTLENEKFQDSDLDINELILLGVNHNNLPIPGKENGLANVEVCSP